MCNYQGVLREGHPSTHWSHWTAEQRRRERRRGEGSAETMKVGAKRFGCSEEATGTEIEVEIGELKLELVMVLNQQGCHLQDVLKEAPIHGGRMEREGRSQGLRDMIDIQE